MWGCAGKKLNCEGWEDLKGTVGCGLHKGQAGGMEFVESSTRARQRARHSGHDKKEYGVEQVVQL